MEECKHLTVTPSKEFGNGLTTGLTAFCGLKTDPIRKAEMALEAHKALGIPPVANTGCPYYAKQKCGDCLSRLL